MKDYKELSRIEFNKQAEKFDTAKNYYKVCQDSHDPANKEVAKEPFKNFLDMGCGTGNTIESLIKNYPDAHYTGIDIAEKMIEVAKKKVQNENVEFVVGDSENLPFEDNKFDVILCKESIHHYPNPEKFFNEAYRVLRPNGRLIIVDMNVNAVTRLFWNKVLFPHIINLGDCHVFSEAEIKEYYTNHGFVVLNFQSLPKWRFISSGRKVEKEN
ncbi:methylase [Neocallimastix lanati (nom. inval.)]|jgi:ubiquinone/menaquinone biosynthesis C-methylase UbiE|uniref:Methylase n=1 Tax=Neocallimastix californiae TaxID=1754190 RepID=A0A1Y2E8X6_9FUNG|nr:methylase [Neocallimastix sp. JGI-2020a]ORY67992.1 methylase [Neocallimastix californiae]|eukprot:ORY67992.1 methylase [Neocallimastix californiae]